MSCGGGIGDFIEEPCEGANETYVDGGVDLPASVKIGLVVLAIVFVILGLIMLIRPRLLLGEGFEDPINEGTLSNILYYQKPNGKLGQNDK